MGETNFHQMTAYIDEDTLSDDEVFIKSARINAFQ